MQATSLKSFTDLQTEFELHPIQFFRYLQVRHTLIYYILNLTELPEFNPLQAKILTDELQDHNISEVYISLVVDTPDAFPQLRKA